VTTISASVVADSIGEHSPRLTTLLLRYPRCIHAEFMTHRVFSRNASSSRAVPVKKLIQDVLDDPFIPLYWGKNQKGMQAVEEHDALVNVPEVGYFSRTLKREDAWLQARDEAVHIARAFDEAGYHKQIVNRLLEPFSHITVVVTATEWSNFFALRRHKDAEPHIHMLADRMWEAMQASTPKLLKPGQWHLPFVNTMMTNGKHDGYRIVSNDLSRIDRIAEQQAIKLSVARCASTSYKTVEGFDMTLERAIALHDKLVGGDPLHASPCEHQAQVDEWRRDAGYDGFRDIPGFDHESQRGNMAPGWIQYRKTLPGESK